MRTFHAFHAFQCVIERPLPGMVILWLLSNNRHLVSVGSVYFLNRSRCLSEKFHTQSNTIKHVGYIGSGKTGLIKVHLST